MINTTALLVIAVVYGVAKSKQISGGYQPTNTIDTNNPPKQISGGYQPTNTIDTNNPPRQKEL